MKIEDRDVIYPEKEVRVCEASEALTVDQVKEILGWTVVNKDEKFHFKDRLNNRVYCSNVQLQRPYYRSTTEHLMWEHLAGNWYNNMETIILGRTGLVVEGKHRLASIVWAAQEYRKSREKYPFWKDEPTMDCTLALGASEELKVINTLGTGKRRSLSDSLFACGLFDNDKPKVVKTQCKMLDHSVRLLWSRTGAKKDAFTKNISHSEAFDFIDRHPKITECVRHIYGENSGKARLIDKIIPTGYASGLMYLMMCSNSDPTEYQETDRPTEDVLDFSNEELAEKFWLSIARREEETMPVIHTVAKLMEVGNTSLRERLGIIVKAWNLYAEDKTIRSSAIRVKHKTDDEGNRRMIENPAVDGIDLGTL